MPQVSVSSPWFATKQEAEAWMTNYYKQYHPAGYGTDLKINTVESIAADAAAYQVVGDRWDSCD